MVNYNMYKEAKEYIKKNNRVKAYKLLKELHEYEPRNKEIAYECGKCAMALGKFDYARSLLSEVAKDSSWNKALYELGRLDVKENKIEDAKIKFNEVLYRNPDDLFATYELVKIEYRFGNKEKAINELKQLLETEIRDLALIQLADIYFNDKKYTKAENLYKEVLRLPSDKLSYGKLFKCYTNLGKICASRHEEKEAIKYLEKAITYYYDIAIELQLAKLYYRNGYEDKSLELYEKISKKEKGLENDCALLEIGIIYFNKKEYDKALEIFDKLKGFEKFRLTAMFYIAKIHFLYKNYDEAKTIFMELAKQDHKNSIYEYAKMLLGIGQINEAKEILGAYLKNNNDVKLLYLYGVCEKNLGNMDEAIKIFRKICNPSMKSEAYKQLTYIYIRKNMYKEAYKYLKKSLKIHNNKTYDVYNALYFLKVKLGIIESASKENDSYINKQIDNYCEEDAIEHIKLHCYEDETKNVHTTFLSDIDVEEMYYEAKEIIKSVDPIGYTFVDKYLIDYEYEIGNINGNPTSELQVITLPNSKNIITMYPFNRFIDDNSYEEYTLEKEEKPKVRRLSQIEKFNLKYNKNTQL